MVSGFEIYGAIGVTDAILYSPLLSTRSLIDT